MQLPEVPADLKICFARQVPAPPAGALSKRQLFDLVAQLKASADAKSDCGQRLACWYGDIARSFSNNKDQAAPECRSPKE